jgi:peptide deformylase
MRENKNNELLASAFLISTIVIAMAIMMLPDKESRKAVEAGNFTDKEISLLASSDSTMHVYTVNDSSETRVLRMKSSALSDSAIASKTFRTLSAKMLATVESPEEDGVGIAAPQVGINRRVIAVKRYDKPGEPFEVYANAKLDTLIGPMEKGPEGCLSVPPMKGIVARYSSVVVSYTDQNTFKTRRDTVKGYSAIIFQHECDHLDGILYIDKADTVYVDKDWEAQIEKSKKALKTAKTSH